MALVYVNGALLEEEQAMVSAFDHGLVVGDGVFETILLRHGSPFALTRHLARLERSAQGLGIGPVDRSELTTAVGAVAKSASFDPGRIRVTLTAGRGPLGSGRLAGPCSLVVACEPLGEGVPRSAVVVVPWSRNEHGALVGLKTTSYAENVLALAFAEAREADEAIFANNAGMLCEGTGSNIFIVREGELLTPPLSSGCLAGVTRALVLERIGGQEANIAIGELKMAEVTEAFLTSTLRGVQPIARVDDRSFPDAPGEVTALAIAKYETLLDEVDPQ